MKTRRGTLVRLRKDRRKGEIAGEQTFQGCRKLRVFTALKLAFPRPHLFSLMTAKPPQARVVATPVWPVLPAARGERGEERVARPAWWVLAERPSGLRPRGPLRFGRELTGICLRCDGLAKP